jgi:hypothetical protein
VGGGEGTFLPWRIPSFPAGALENSELSSMSGGRGSTCTRRTRERYGISSRGAWGVVENYSSAIEQACQEMLRVQLHTTHGPPPTRLRSFDAATDGKGAFIMGGFWCQRHGCSWAQPLAAQPASCLPSLADHDVLRFPGAVAFAPGCAHGKTLVQHIYGQMEQLKLDSHLSLGSRNTKIHDASSLCAASATL